MKRQLTIISALLPLAIALAGCAHLDAHWQGPAMTVPVSVKPWQDANLTGRTIRTQHYLIHTTIDDPHFDYRLGQLMEGALDQYQKLAPDVATSARPMECYVFASREQWEAFTRRSTGAESAIYLRVNRGGYTIDDWYACYFIGDVGTYSVASHEGWHQFLGRHFRNPIPPFLEEGIATTFQNLRWQGNLPRWNVADDPARLDQLKHVLKHEALFPLSNLVKMHAGEVVAMSPERIEAFYAQNWAFARFLIEGDNGRYLPALQKMLADASAGALYHPPLKHSPQEWDPEVMKPLLEHYLQTDLVTLDRSFHAYIAALARRA